MDLLYSNDKKGTYPQSWYAATADFLPEQKALRGETQADVCVVGAGFTGLSTALHLAERGFNVVVLDAHRVGFGASGRNGGQLGSGQRMEQDGLEKLVGRDDAHKLWLLAEEAKRVTKGLIEKHQIDCYLKPGIAHTGLSRADMSHEHAYVEKLQLEYGYDQISALSTEEMQEICPSPAYFGGSLDMGAAHLHPLSYVLGLGRAALAAGVRIFEKSHVHNIQHGTKPVVQTDRGRVVCDHVVLAGNGYLSGLERKVAARVMPINNFIIATEPLGDEAQKVLTRDIAVADSKFVVNYFRLSHDGRLLFGGGETYGLKFPRDIAAQVRAPLRKIFPHLRNVRIDYAWGGTLAITMKRMPYMARVAPNVLSSSGYSGHGVGTATHAGLLMAQAIAGNAEGFDTLSRVPATRFPGGAFTRAPLMAMAMTWYKMRDHLGV